MKKDTLVREYFDNKLSFKQIAEKYNTSASTIHKKFKEYGLVARPKWKTPNLGKELTEAQEKFVFAKLLGDGCITKSKHHATYHFEFSHEEKQREYSKLCASKLEGWGTYSEKVRKRDPQIYKKHTWTECVFKSCNHKEFSRIYRYFYEYGKKIVNKEILSLVDEFGLAIWFADDGHIDTKKNAGYLNTLNFSLEENKMIVEWLWDTFKIRANVVKAGKSRNGKDVLYRIRLSASTWEKFCSIVEPYLTSDIKYKIGKDIVRS